MIFCLSWFILYFIPESEMKQCFFSFGHIKQQTTRIQQNKLIESILSKPNVHFSTFMKYLWPQFKKNTLWVLEIMMFLCLAIKLKDESNDGLNIKCYFCRNFAILTIITTQL